MGDTDGVRSGSRSASDPRVQMFAGHDVPRSNVGQVTKDFTVTRSATDPDVAKSGPPVTVPPGATVLVVPLRGNVNVTKVSVVGQDSAKSNGISLLSSEVPREFSVTSLDQIWGYNAVGEGFLIQVRRS